MESWMVELVITGVVGILGWLAASKDKAQQDQIDALKKECAMLFAKHDADVEALRNLEVKVAESYHKKPEIEERFKRLEDVMLEGFKSLRGDLQRLFSEMHKGGGQ